MSSCPPNASSTNLSLSASAPSSSTGRYVVRETPFAPFFDKSIEGSTNGILGSWTQGSGGRNVSVEDHEEAEEAEGGESRAHIQDRASSSSDDEEDDGPPPRPLTPIPSDLFPPTFRAFPSGRRREASVSIPANGPSSSSSSSSLPYNARRTAPHTFNLAFSAPPITHIESGHSTSCSFPNEALGTSSNSSSTPAQRPRSTSSSEASKAGSSRSTPPAKKARTSKGGQGKRNSVDSEEEDGEDASGMEDREFTSHDPPGYSWGIPVSSLAFFV